MTSTVLPPRRTIRSNGNLDLLKPVIRAYVFGHVSSTGPRLLGAVLAFVSKHQSLHRLFSKITVLLLQSLSRDKFPYFCAYLVSLHQIIKTGLLNLASRSRHFNGPHHTRIIQLSVFIAAASASWISLPLLNTSRGSSQPELESSSNEAFQGSSQTNPETHPSPPPPDKAGKTLDLTILASTRALETLVFQTWRRTSQRLPPSLSAPLSSAADPSLFILSAGIIMWSWFYHPSRLPPSYNKWISSAASVDSRLIEVLRAAREGTFVYGARTGPADSLLRPMCREFGWPETWGDPEFIPDGIPCELVHSGVGPSCHLHGVWRFVKAFRFALVMYLPLQLIIKFRSRPLHRAPEKLQAALREACRSAAFLGGFVSAFYYAVCLARTLVGPKLVPKRWVSSQMWDSGLCVGAGCAACGWSVFIEQPRRRLELAMFVAPRALAAMLPRRYKRESFWRERAAFAASVGVLFTAAGEGSKGVRGVVGALLHGVLH